MDKQTIDSILKYVKDNKDKIDFNNRIFEILEGDLSKYVLEALKKQLNSKSADIAALRMAPINIWNKVVKKLSKIYVNPVTRKTENQGDQEIIDSYVKDGVNSTMLDTNENYNSYKWSGTELYEDFEEEAIKTRSIPSNAFIVYGGDPSNPLKVKVFIKFMGTHKNAQGNEKQKIWIYTDDEFISVLDDGEIVEEDISESDGINPYGVIPFEYIGMSKNLLVPIPDGDTYQMTILIPVLITDTAYGSMYLSFPLVYTVDAEAGSVPVSPNIAWDLKSDNVDKQAKVGVVRAEPDLEAQMSFCHEVLAMWLDSRDIKVGSNGKLSSENFSSGISKLIAEMDTAENMKLQKLKFSEYENKFWRRLARMHNLLATAGRIKDRRKFQNPETLEVEVEFSDEKIVETREDRIKRLKLERDAKFKSTKRAIKELNPKMTDTEITQEMLDISNEFTVEIDEQSEA